MAGGAFPVFASCPAELASGIECGVFRKNMAPETSDRITEIEQATGWNAYLETGNFNSDAR